MVARLNKSHGLRLAEQHGSAKGQVDARKVYKEIKFALKQESNLTPTIRRNIRANAMRIALDRLQRLGERVRGNYRVSKRDREIMLDEFEVLKNNVVSIFKDQHSKATVFDDKEGMTLKRIPEQMARLAEAIFGGEIKVKDRVSLTGTKLTEKDDHHIIDFEGTYYLNPEVTFRRIEPIDVLTTQIDTAGTRIENSYTRDEYGNNKLDDLVSVVKDRILADASDPLATHGIAASMNSMSLLFE